MRVKLSVIFLLEQEFHTIKKSEKFFLSDLTQGFVI